MSVLTSGINVLVIAENRKDFLLISNYLRKEAEQPNLSHVQTLAKANEVLIKNCFDIILLDVASSHLRKNPLVKNTVELSEQTPVIVITGNESRDKEEEILNIGIADYLLKDELTPFLLVKSISYSIERNHINQSLRKSEQQYRNLFDLSPLPKWVFDTENLQVLDVNQRATEVYGYSREEFLSMTIKEFLTDDNAKPILQKSLRAQKTHNGDIHTHQTKGGSFIKANIRSRQITFNGKQAQIVTATNITDKIERKQKLQDSLELYKYVTKATDDVIYDWNIRKDTFEWDDSFHEKYVYNIQDNHYTIDDWAKNVHPNDLAGVEESLSDVLASDQSKWEQEYRFKKQNGTYATVFERGFIIRNQQGEATRMIGSLQDITDRKKYEEKLEELALVASKTTDIIFMTDANERITWTNNAFEKVLGYSFNEVVGKSPGNILRGPENDPKTMRRISKAFNKQEPIQEVVLNYSQTGDKYWFDLTLDPIFDSSGSCKGFIGIQKDVTNQIKQQHKLRESVERYEIVSKATSDTIWDLNLAEDTIEYNQNIYGMFGYQKGEVKKVGQWWRDKLHPDDKDQVMNQLEQALTADTDRFQMEYRFETASGTYKYIYDRAFIVTNNSGSPIRIIGAMQDVTQQRKEQKWLKLFEYAVANTKESIAILEAQPSDMPGREILYVNSAFSNMTGYTEKEAVGKTLHLLNGPQTDPQKRKTLSQHLDRWEPCELELINYKKSGEEFWVRLSLTPVQGPNDTHYWVCVGRDITERKKNETQLKESLKEKETLLLEIHHRVKNNLAVVSGMIQMQAYDAKNKEFRGQLFDSIARIQTMGSIHELLYKSESFSQLNFHDNIKKLITELSNTFQTDSDISVKYNVESIHLNINQAIPCSLIVNEVVTNVFKHAFSDNDTGLISVSAKEEDQKVMLSIEDNGKGLPDNFDSVRNQNTLGFKLINTLSKQLTADYSFTSLDNGTRFEISFEKADIKGIGNSHLS